MAENRHSFQLNDLGTIYTMAPFGILDNFSSKECIPNLKSQVFGLKNLAVNLAIELNKIVESNLLSNDYESIEKIDQLLDIAEELVSKDKRPTNAEISKN